jgi:hypothetical protein
MPLIKFKVSWEEDDATYRNIVLVSSQSFFEFHTCIKFSLQFPENMEGLFYLIDEKRVKGITLSSVVEKNLRGAPELSMKKTPVGALITDPDQKFIYECVHPKAWTFLVEIISISPFDSDLINYPKCIKSEGISPVNFISMATEKDAVAEIVEKYDLNNTEGFGDEGEDETGLDGFGEEGAEESGGFGEEV